MGHDHHFLSRLDRVNDSQVELALALYRDHEALTVLLHAHRFFIPEGTDRVAVALDDGGEGPHLIVARDRHFVTCLGKGMTPDAGDPLITREQLDRFLIGTEAYRSMVGSFADPAYEGLGRLLRRVTGTPHLVAREDVRDLVAVAPMIDSTLVAHFEEVQVALLNRYHRVGHVKGMRGTDRMLLENWWRATWTYGVLAPVMALRDVRDFERQESDRRRTFGWMGVAQGIMPVAMRTIWAAGRVGRVQLDTYRDDIERGHRTLSLVNAIPTLLVVAQRYPLLEPEVRELLSPDRLAHLNGGEPWVESKLVKVREALDVLDSSASRDAGFVEFGRAQAVARKELGFSSTDEVPEDVARCVALDSRLNYFLEDDARRVLMNATPWLARARPEELFLPRKFVKLLEAPYSTERAMEATAHLRAVVSVAPRPQAAPRSPGPNEPCSCASGRKYKKCCGAPKSG